MCRVPSIRLPAAISTPVVPSRDPSAARLCLPFVMWAAATRYPASRCEAVLGEALQASLSPLSRNHLYPALHAHGSMKGPVAIEWVNADVGKIDFHPRALLRFHINTLDDLAIRALDGEV